MLVLSRHRDEEIIIDGRIRIIVVDIRRDKVRLGIEAPADVAVHRKEIADAIEASRQQQADPKGSPNG